MAQDNEEDEMVMVKISGEQRFMYCQTVQMLKSKFNEINNGLESGSRQEKSLLVDLAADYIDLDDVCDSEQFQLDEFFIEDGK